MFFNVYFLTMSQVKEGVAGVQNKGAVSVEVIKRANDNHAGTSKYGLGFGALS